MTVLSGAIARATHAGHVADFYGKSFIAFDIVDIPTRMDVGQTVKLRNADTDVF